MKICANNCSNMYDRCRELEIFVTNINCFTGEVLKPPTRVATPPVTAHPVRLPHRRQDRRPPCDVRLCLFHLRDRRGRGLLGEPCDSTLPRSVSPTVLAGSPRAPPARHQDSGLSGSVVSNGIRLDITDSLAISPQSGLGPECAVVLASGLLGSAGSGSGSAGSGPSLREVV